MEKKRKTYVALILDKSGSMKSTQAQTIEGYNEHVQQIKLDAKEQEIFVSLVTFNAQVYEHLWNEPADRLSEASADDYKPDGGTALRDAVGYTIDKLSETAVVDDDTAFLIIIISDGCENSSQHVSTGMLKEKIQDRQKRGNWTFTYMGCNESYLQEVSQQTSIPISNMAAWDNKSAVRCRGGMTESSKKLKKYFAGRASGQKAVVECYHSEDAMLCANYEGAGVDVDHNSASAPAAIDLQQAMVQPSVHVGQTCDPNQLYQSVLHSADLTSQASPQWVAPESKTGTSKVFSASKPVTWA
jgi:uncharacterized protein YegL